jgi:hypothetical protein
MRTDLAARSDCWKDRRNLFGIFPLISRRSTHSERQAGTVRRTAVGEPFLPHEITLDTRIRDAGAWYSR